MLTKKPKRLALVAMALAVAVVLPNAVSAATIEVSIIDFAFVPAEVRIAPGDTVVWRNNGIQPHTATHCVRPTSQSPCNPPLFDSGILATGQTFSFTFPTPGTFPYICQIHPFMTGVVIVAADGTTTTSTPTTQPTTTTSTSTTTTSTTSTTQPTTTTTSTTSTTQPTTTTSTSTTSTTQPTTTTSTSTTSTTRPPTTTTTQPTTTSTTRPPTTTTTVVTPPPTGDVCDALVAARASFNARIDRFRDTIRNAFGSAVAQLFLPQLEQVRAQGNAQFDRALAACRGAFPGSDSSAATTEREATASL